MTMAFAEDLSVFFNPAEFADPATLGGVAVQGGLTDRFRPFVAADPRGCGGWLQGASKGRMIDFAIPLRQSPKGITGLCWRSAPKQTRPQAWWAAAPAPLAQVLHS